MKLQSNFINFTKEQVTALRASAWQNTDIVDIAYNFYA
jgi:hypothetical protein